MNLVFADSFYLIASLNRRDPYRERVLELSKSLRSRVLTSDWVLAEVADALSKSAFRPRIRDYIATLRRAPNFEIVPASRNLFDLALEFYHQHSDKQWSLTDCTSFVIMRDRGVAEALTGDKHFE
jgi:predicted nucleic acid-binding protein